MDVIEPKGENWTAWSGPGATCTDWSLAHRVAFRFLFSYLALYNIIDILAPRSFTLLPGLSHLVVAHAQAWRVIVPWVGKHILHLSQDITDRPVTGFAGGDTTFNYVRILTYVFISGLVTIVWSLVDARRREYRWLHDWLRAYVRYTLALTMLVFAAGKSLQFPYPSFTRLLEPLGQFEPTQLMWAFMGESTLYKLFAGATELVGGLLLLFRHTTTIGAIVTAGVTLNVTLMNLSYDVPVKLLALHQVLLCGFLIIPDGRRLLNGWVLNRPVAPAAIGPAFQGRSMRIVGMILKITVIGYAVFAVIKTNVAGEKRLGAWAPKSPLYGIWEVEEFSRNGQPLPPLVTDSSRWRMVIVQNPFQSPFGLFVRLMDGTVKSYSMVYDEGKGTLAVAVAPGAKRKDVLGVSRLDGDHLLIEGRLGTDALKMNLRRIDDSKLPLLSRRFHWINNGPWNPR